MNIGALPRRCRPLSLMESGPLKSSTKHNNRARVPFFPCAHERRCEALGFMDRRCVGQVERKSRPFAIEYSYIRMVVINSTFTGCLESHRDSNRHVRRTLAIPINYILNGSLCAVDHPRFSSHSKYSRYKLPWPNKSRPGGCSCQRP